MLRLEDAQDTRHKPGRMNLQLLQLLCFWSQNQGMHFCIHLFIASLNDYNILGNFLEPQATW